ncbi:hypothetical protein SLEP1_g18887 [Rubroshorea leprosula]|uniref:Uncharacterized protein n=1 Tax=Rubroshorea leprosula TaxID=152421 RepID=A0AAV5J846_9ROSI|nr:hypothetical protein SLEP1_g18887 [Rubroshorea leprosula]
MPPIPTSREGIFLDGDPHGTARGSRQIVIPNKKHYHLLHM